MRARHQQVSTIHSDHSFPCPLNGNFIIVSHIEQFNTIYSWLWFFLQLWGHQNTRYPYFFPVSGGLLLRLGTVNLEIYMVERKSLSTTQRCQKSWKATLNGCYLSVLRKCAMLVKSYFCIRKSDHRPTGDGGGHWLRGPDGRFLVVTPWIANYWLNLNSIQKLNYWFVIRVSRNQSRNESFR